MCCGKVVCGNAVCVGFVKEQDTNADNISSLLWMSSWFNGPVATNGPIRFPKSFMISAESPSFIFSLVVVRSILFLDGSSGIRGPSRMVKLGSVSFYIPTLCMQQDVYN